ncbi:MAG: response regulator [Bacteroidota bacterium]
MKDKNKVQEEIFGLGHTRNLNRAKEVLIVDDFPENLMFVGEYLEQHNLSVKFATHGEKALQICAESPPDIILLDIAMPKMDGYEICARIKRNPLTQDIPVVFLTAKVEKDDIIRGFDNGGIDYITKPFSMQELLSRVKAHLSLKGKYDKLQLMNSKLLEVVKQRSEKLSRDNEGLSKIDKIKNDFLLHINHQLRTPLNGIVGYTRLLEASELTEEQTDFVKEINRLVDRLVKLSERSLLFTELRAESYKMAPVNVKLQEVVEYSLEIAKQRYPEKSFDFKCIGGLSDVELVTDENLLNRCFAIVLDNAVRFSPPAGTITMKTRKYDQFLYVSISDEGPGISQEYLSRAFELFTIDTLKEDNVGFGLGLATAKMIMSILNGKIELQSPPGGGTTVKLFFRT